MANNMITDIKELLNIANDVKKNLGDKDGKRIMNDIIGGTYETRSRSIKRATADSIFQFPVLVSQNISLDTTMLVAKSLEYDYLNYLKMTINQIDYIDLDKNKTKIDFLKSLHQNDYPSSSFLNQDISQLASTEKGLKESNMVALQPYVENFNYKHLDGTLMESKEEEKNFLEKTKELEIKTKQNDVAKINLVSPLTLEMQIKYKNGDNMHDTNLMFGLKTVVHSINSKEIIENLPKSIQEDRILFRFIQWTTGEISFWKDLVFNYDSLKKDASRDNQNKWWNHLKNRNINNRFRNLFNKEKFIPNATMVVSMEEIDQIKYTTGLDLIDEDKGDVYKLMNIYFLLSFIVVDEINELIYIYNDNTYTWEIKNLSSIKPKTKKVETINVNMI